MVLFTMKRIEEFSDTEIIEELMRRYDDIVIGARKILDVKGEDTNRRWWYKGDPDACAGLIIGVSHKLVNETWRIRDND